jgi:hypothetical protein
MRHSTRANRAAASLLRSAAIAAMLIVYRAPAIAAEDFYTGKQIIPPLHE